MRRGVCCARALLRFRAVILSASSRVDSILSRDFEGGGLLTRVIRR